MAQVITPEHGTHKGAAVHRQSGLQALLQRRAAAAPGLLRDAAPQVAALRTCGIALDISRQRLNPADRASLCDLARELDVIGAHRAMMRGAVVNASEQRAALHTALRAPAGAAEVPAEIGRAVQRELARLRAFAQAVRGSEWRSAAGHAFTDVINIGIGGSDSGPRLAYAALADGALSNERALRVHFLSNVDGHGAARLLPRLDATRTLVVVSSKSFSTRETLLNAAAVRAWLQVAGIDGPGLAQHMVCVSGRNGAAVELGLPAANQFHLWDWVGGRFSVWSAIGLPVMLAIGPGRFDEFLAGAHAMDRHSLEAPLEHNLPATLALLALWNRLVVDTTSLCLLTYDDRLAPMVTWLQQLQMESLGKSVSADGAPLAVAAGEVVWGGVGTDAQHTFFQALRQGALRTAIDIVFAGQPDHGYVEHHRALLANARAQAEALVAPDAAAQAVNAVSVLELDALTPATLGSLLALYEHKTTMLATLLGINAFDQPGVELGKQLARDLEAQ